MASSPSCPVSGRGEPAVAGGRSPHPDATGGSAPPPADPILCQHCGRTASNGISCQGMCVADSGY